MAFLEPGEEEKMFEICGLSFFPKFIILTWPIVDKSLNFIYFTSITLSSWVLEGADVGLYVQAWRRKQENLRKTTEPGGATTTLPHALTRVRTQITEVTSVLSTTLSRSPITDKNKQY